MGGVSCQSYFVPGNHDIGDKNNPTVPSYIINEDYIINFKKFYGPTYQSFDHHGIHFILFNSLALNSGLQEEEEQRNWLETDLETNKNKRIIVFSFFKVNLKPFSKFSREYDPPILFSFPTPNQIYFFV